MPLFPNDALFVTMDVAVAVFGYVSRIAALGDGAAGSSAKMKILLLDSETVGFETEVIGVCADNCLRCQSCRLQSHNPPSSNMKFSSSIGWPIQVERRCDIYDACASLDLLQTLYNF